MRRSASINRDEFDLVSDILTTCLNGRGRLVSHIAEATKMQHDQLKRRLRKLERAGYIARRAEPGRGPLAYITTSQGLAFLETIARYRSS